MDWIIGAVPLVTGLAMGQLCPVKPQPNPPSAQPCGYVFAIVWPLLYIAMGVAWVSSRRAVSVDALFLLLTALLLLWQYLYGCRQQPKLALYTLVAAIATALVLCFAIVGKARVAAMLLGPLLAWLLFALLLNAEIVSLTELQ